MPRRALDFIDRYSRPILLWTAVIRILLIGVLIASGLISPFIGFNAEVGYLQLGERLFNEWTYNDPVQWQGAKFPPGYALIIAVLRTLGVGSSSVPVYLVLLQNVADVVTALCIYRLAYRRVGQRAAFVATMCWLMFPLATVLSCWVTPETFFTTALIAGIFVMAGERPDVIPPPRQMALAGALFGIATMLRATPQALVPVLALIVLWRGGVARAAALAAAFACFTVPWIVRNRIVLDDDFGLAAGFASPFLQGVDEATFDGWQKVSYFERWSSEAEAAGYYKPKEFAKASEAERWMRQLGMLQYKKRWKERPWSFPGFALLKIARLWYGTENSRPGRDLGIFLLSAIAVLPGLAWIVRGWLKSSRSSRGALWNFSLYDYVVMATLGYFIALHAIALPMVRYMVPVLPLILIGTGQLVDAVVKWHTRPAIASSSQVWVVAREQAQV